MRLTKHELGWGYAEVVEKIMRSVMIRGYQAPDSFHIFTDTTRNVRRRWIGRVDQYGSWWSRPTEHRRDHVGRLRNPLTPQRLFSGDPHWLKFKNPEAPAGKREAEEDWGR